jgi:xanthine dehydrogenase accessory factor
MEPLRVITRAIRRGKRAALVTVTGVEGEPPSKPGMTLAVEEGGGVEGTLGCDGFDRAGAADGLEAIEKGKAITRLYEWDDGSSITVAVKPFGPGDVVADPAMEAAELLVVGTGPVARALVALGEVMGYVTRVAAGPSAPSVGEFERADEVVVTPDARTVQAMRPGPRTYVVICGHDEEFSQPVLKSLIESGSPYLGMMGSRRHTGHLLDELRAEGFSGAQLARVHTPVGLDLGASTPEEIALSALAQIVAVRRGGAGRPLQA